MSNWKFIKDKSNNTDYDLFTWKFQNLYIQKFRSEKEYSVFVKFYDTGNIIHDFKYIGSFPKLSHAKYISETYFKDNL